MVRRIKGKGSKTGTEGTLPVFIRIQAEKKTRLAKRKAMLPKEEVSQSAILIVKGLFLRAFASKLSMIWWEYLAM